MPLPVATPTQPSTAPSPRGHDAAVVILNWNAAADTLACVTRLATWTHVQPHVWVVDNASSAEDVAQIRAGLAATPVAVTLIENDANRGFAGGCNVGIAAALASGDAPILLLNNDAGLDEAAITRMMATLADEPAACMVGPLLMHGDKLLNAGHRDPARHHHTSITHVPPEPVATVDYISGSVALIRAAALRTVGLLDEAYFFNGEVADLCRRARAAGYVTLVDSRARAEHDLDRSAPLRNTLYTYYLVRNRLRYAGKYARLRWAGWVGYSLLLAGKLFLRGERASATAVRLAVADALAGRWGGQNARVLAACRRARTVR